MRQGEHVTLVKREKEGEGLCMHDRCRGKLAAWLLVSGPVTMPPACSLAFKCFCHLVHAWLKGCPKLLGRDTNLAEVTWLEGT
jgi:hypothetical protein